MFVALNGANGANGADSINAAAALFMLGVGVPCPIGASPWPDIQNGRLQWRAQLGVNNEPAPNSLYDRFGGEAPRLPADVPEFRGWTIENSTVAAIAETLAMASRDKPDWPKECDPYPWDPEKVPRELGMLLDLKAYRDGVMSEATAQATGIIPYFQALAGFTATSHRETTNLCIIALNLGQFMVMYYKQRYNRPRPSQLCPALLPAMEVPGHASYPSGHSTETHLIADFLKFVIGEDSLAYRLLDPLADRIAINREVMGLHYRSDSEAGERLARKVTNLVFSLPLEKRSDGKYPVLYETFIAALKEWHSNQDFDQAWDRYAKLRAA